MLRDSPLDTPITDELFAVDSYHLDKKAEAEERLKTLSDPDLAKAEYEKTMAESKQKYEEETKEVGRELALLRKYKECAGNMVSPSRDHDGARLAMIEQIDASIRETKLPEPKHTAPFDVWLTKEIADATWEVEYHERAQKDEAERQAKRKQWHLLYTEMIEKAV